MWRRVLASIVLLAHGGDALAQSCRVLGPYGRAPDNAVVRVTSGGLVSFRANVDVNTDGALQSYKADDLGFFPGGRLTTRTALNTICNGVNIRDSAGAVVLDYRQCGRLIAEFERIRGFGWHRAGDNYVDFYAIARRPGTERPGVNRGVPCEQDGYYVSQTARPMEASRGVCDPDRWIDALRIPAIVLPLDDRMRSTGAALHDLAAVRLPGSDRWVGAIVGDTNRSKIGEGTVRLVQALRGDFTVPANYRAVVALALPAADYLVFPRTAGEVANRSNDSGEAIATAAAAALGRHGITGTAPVCP